MILDMVCGSGHRAEVLRGKQDLWVYTLRIYVDDIRYGLWLGAQS